MKFLIFAGIALVVLFALIICYSCCALSSMISRKEEESRSE